MKIVNPFSYFYYKNIPRIAPVNKVEIVPLINALIPNVATSPLRSGASDVNAPT